MFFSQFPSIAYDFNRTGTVERMVDIFRSIRPETLQELDQLTTYKEYEINSGMRPDVLSSKLYGTPDYYWTFFIINDFLHDGLQVWPLSENMLRKYIEKNYSGVALAFKPDVVEDSDGIPQGTKNSVAGILKLGELVYGGTSGAIGRLVRKDADLNQLILQDVVKGQIGIDPFSGAGDPNIVGGNFRPGEFLSASRTTLDSTTLFSLQVHKVYSYASAPAYYYENRDPLKRPITNPDGVSQLLNIYSDIQWDDNLQRQVRGFDLQDFGQYGATTQSNAAYAYPLTYSGGYAEYGENLRAGYENSEQYGGVDYVSNEQHLRTLNENRSKIKIIDPKYILIFIEEFENLLNA